MARPKYIWPARICAVTAVVLAPVLGAAGPSVDTKELRSRLSAAHKTVGQSTAVAADVALLRDTLGLGAVDLPLEQIEDVAATPAQQVVPPGKPAALLKPVVAKPALAPLALTPAPTAQPAPLPDTGGLFALQASQTRAVNAPAATGFGAGGLFAVQNAQPQTTQEPVAIIGDTPLIVPQTAPLKAPAPALQQPFGGAGGLFAVQNAQAPAALSGAMPTGGRAALAPLEVTTANFRLMLATLTQTYSGVNNLSVVTAQGARGPIALSVKSGTVGLKDLKSFSAAQGYGPREDGSLILPVVIWPDATLRLTAGERLLLARDTGTFILSMGRMEVTGATIDVTGPSNPHEKVFTPFVSIASGGSLVMEGATVRGLGFGRTLKFAGLTVAGNPLMPTQQEVSIRNTLFDQVRTVTIAGAPQALIEGNTFQDARGNAVNLIGSPRAQLRRNLFRGTSPTNAVRVDVGSDGAVVAENVFLRGARMAILINGGSNSVQVRENLIWQRDGGGLKFFNVRCGLAQGNILIDNRQKGIEVRKSDGTMLRDNLLAGGRSAGIWVSAQATGAQTAVQGNTFERNAAGLSAATGAEIWVQGNNFKGQLPKLLDGDIAALTNAISRDLGGENLLKLVVGQSQPQADPVAVCGGQI